MATTQPIKSTADVQRVRDVLNSNRDRALFELGLHLAFRAGDLLCITMAHVVGKQAGDEISLLEAKTSGSKSGQRITTISQQSYEVLQPLIAERIKQGASDADPLFVAARRNAEGKHTQLTVVSLSRMWKDWCAEAGLKASTGMVFGSHSGRKTKAYILRTEGKVGIEVIMKVLRHTSVAVTMRYACIQDDEVRAFHTAVI